MDFLRSLSRITDPAAFAADSVHAPSGAINAFVLLDRDGEWDWQAYDNPTVIRFSPRQFSRRQFAIFRGLPDDTVLAVRRRPESRDVTAEPTSAN